MLSAWTRDGNMAFIGDGTELASDSDSHSIRIHDIVDLAAKHWNAIHGYEPVSTRHEGRMDGGSG